MSNITNMKKVIEVVRKYFDRNVELTILPCDGEYIEHPFLNSLDFIRFTQCTPALAYKDFKYSEILENPILFRRLKDIKWNRLRKLSVPQLIAAAEPCYRFHILRDAADFLSADDLSFTLRAIWPDYDMPVPSEAGECTKDEVVKWFSSCNPEKVMPPIEIKPLPLMRDVITIYRGKSGLMNTDPADAVSWMLSPILAMEDPENSRFGAYYFEGGYKASIKRDGIMAYFYHNGMEIVLNQNKLFGIEFILAMGDLLANYASEVSSEQRDWYRKYLRAEAYRLLMKKLEPLGRVNELIEAMMDPEKFDRLFFEFRLGQFLKF